MRCKNRLALSYEPNYIYLLICGLPQIRRLVIAIGKLLLKPSFRPSLKGF